MKSVSVDPGTRTVRVGGGCVWGEVDAATQPHALAVPTGIISSTGVAGLTLGGGHGYLSRRHGLTIDNLLAAKMVLADGSQVTASADENPDLFWAIRGGGGNFGVVTEFTFQAHPLETIVGGPTFWAIEDTDVLLSAYREWLPSAPRNVSGFFNWHTIPPAEPFPEELHMRLVCGIVWCIDASDEEAEKAMEPLLSLAEPLMHGVGRMPIAALNSAFDGLYGPGDQWYARADFVREIPDEAIERNREWNVKMPTFKSGSHVYPDRRRGARRRAGGHGVLLPRRDLVAGVHRRGRRPCAGGDAQGVDDRVLGGAAPVLGRRRLRQLHDGRGPGTREGDVRPQLRAAGAGQAHLRPGQRLPGQPEHRSCRLASGTAIDEATSMVASSMATDPEGLSPVTLGHACGARLAGYGFPRLEAGRPEARQRRPRRRARSPRAATNRNVTSVCRSARPRREPRS